MRQIFHDCENSYFGLLVYNTVTDVSEEHATDCLKDDMLTLKKTLATRLHIVTTWKNIVHNRVLVGPTSWLSEGMSVP